MQLLFVFLIFLLPKCLYGAIEYDLIDLGNNFIPTAINESGTVCGFLKTHDPFYGNKNNAALWNELDGMILIQSTDEIDSQAFGLNNSNNLVGKISGGIDFYRSTYPVFWLSETTSWNRLTYTTGSMNAATDINDNFIIVGYGTPRNTDFPHAFVYHPNSDIIDIHPSNKGSSKALKINKEGIVVGEVDLDNSGELYAFIWTPLKGFEILNFAKSSSACSINDHGDILVNTLTNNLNRTFIYFNNQSTVILDLLEGGTWTIGNDINSSREIVGSGWYAGKHEAGKTAFIWKNNRTRSLNKLCNAGPYWWLETATGINNQGYIIGIAVSKEDSETRHGFLLKPTSKHLFRADEDLNYQAIALNIENDHQFPFPEKQFINVNGKTINQWNSSKKAWIQPLSMIDLEREGETKYLDEKLYEVILVYLNNETKKTFTSYDFSHNKKTLLEDAKPGEKYIVPGYFLNDWNNRVNPSTGFVYYWFQTTETLNKEEQKRIISYAKKHAYN